MWLGKNELSRGVIRSVTHAQHPIGSVLELVHLFWVFGIFELFVHHVTAPCRMMNERLKPEDSRDELVNSLSGSHCIGLAYEAVNERTTQTRRLVR